MKPTLNPINILMYQLYCFYSLNKVSAITKSVLHKSATSILFKYESIVNVRLCIYMVPDPMKNKHTQKIRKETKAN